MKSADVASKQIACNAFCLQFNKTFSLVRERESEGDSPLHCVRVKAARASICALAEPAASSKWLPMRFASACERDSA